MWSGNSGLLIMKIINQIASEMILTPEEDNPSAGISQYSYYKALRISLTRILCDTVPRYPPYRGGGRV